MPDHRPLRPRAPRWTADTELAFLFALRLTGSPVAACAAIGRSAPGTYARRHRVPAFRAAWDKVLDELVRTRAAGDVAARGSLTTLRTKVDGFTPLKRRAFLQALGETGRYDKACARVRISIPAATKLRRRDPAFNAQCEEALARSWGFLTETAEQAAYARAVDGVEEPIYRGGEQIGTRRRYSDSLLREVLRRLDARTGAQLTQEERVHRAHDAARAAGGEFGSKASREETNAALLKALDAAGRREAARRAESEAPEESGDD